MKDLDRMYKYTRENENLISLTHVSREVADTLMYDPQHAPCDSIILCYIRDGCVYNSWEDLNYCDADGNWYMLLNSLAGSGEELEITNFIDLDTDNFGDDPENLEKVLQQRVIFK